MCAVDTSRQADHALVLEDEKVPDSPPSKGRNRVRLFDPKLVFTSYGAGCYITAQPGSRPLQVSPASQDRSVSAPRGLLRGRQGRLGRSFREDVRLLARVRRCRGGSLPRPRGARSGLRQTQVRCMWKRALAHSILQTKRDLSVVRCEKGGCVCRLSKRRACGKCWPLSLDVYSSKNVTTLFHAPPGPSGRSRSTRI